MIELRFIRDYIQNTVYALAIATGMEVIICDENSMVLGDSNYEKTKDMDFRENPEFLSDNSIVRQCVASGKPIIIRDCKKENQACGTCVNSQTCGISSIIAYPIIHERRVLGGLGLYAANKDAQILLNEKNEVFNKFVSVICEMLISKGSENANKKKFQSMSERLRLLINSFDEAVLGFDEDGKIVNINNKLFQSFNISKNEIKSYEDLVRLSGSGDFKKFIEQCFRKKEAVKEVMNISGTDTIVSYKPVITEQGYTGAMVSFKKNSDVYKDVRVIKANNDCKTTFDDIIGDSGVMKSLKESARNFSKGPSTIFIHGRSGTGKEMFARAIHNESFRAKGPFVAINCASIPENLIESELFGHKEGAFTGSMKGGQVGKFELADKGTLFLDEIGEMPMHLQPKLLRAIQERKIQPVGSNKSIAVDIRIIAATNRNLEEMVHRGEFREDLYYRLNVIPLELPNLSEREGDIPILLEFFLDKYNSMIDRDIQGFDEEAMKALCSYEWPGNIRELQNVVEYAVNDCREKIITCVNLPKGKFSTEIISGVQEIIPLKVVEEKYIREALARFGTTNAGKTAAAKALGIGRSTFYRKLKEYEIE